VQRARLSRRKVVTPVALLQEAVHIAVFAHFRLGMRRRAGDRMRAAEEGTVRRRGHAWLVLLAVMTAAGVPLTSSAAAAQQQDPFEEICSRWSALYGPAPGPTYPQTDLADRCLRLNQTQVIGSHNSYHIQPREPLWSALRSFDPLLAAGIEYTHSPLGVQFDDEEVRQIELDVFADPVGGLYDQRRILPLLGLPADSGVPELEAPGFKVLHIQEIDFESTCWTFVRCLQQVKLWSDAHPRHLPIAILVELKDEPIPDPLQLGFVQPHPIGPTELDALDGEIRSVFPEQQLLTPNEVRGSRPTLEDAVLTDGWPTLGTARGKVMFLMDNAGRYRTDYLSGHPNLDGRILFTNANPGQPDAAFVKRNDPLGPNVAVIQDLVRRGYLVRTRADADTIQARIGDTTQRDAALLSGAQFVSTDYPVPGRAEPFGTDYMAQIPDGHPARCNPIITGTLCRNDALERLH
jgi:Phosphoinositide phospholipase C, Ca2+-dependent